MWVCLLFMPLFKVCGLHAFHNFLLEETGVPISKKVTKAIEKEGKFTNVQQT